MVKLVDVSYGFGQKDLYHKICFEIEEGEHAVLIGSNGTGKSTLIQMIQSPEDFLFDGKLIRKEGIRIGHVNQYVWHDTSNMTVLEFLEEPFIQMQAKADEVCARMSESEDMESAFEEYQKCLDAIEAVDGYNYDSNIRRQMSIAGISHLEDLTVDKISGGEFKMLSIIRTMLLKPQLLIMDEPDVFLDFENIVGLSKLINNYNGTILTVTHNRLLLNQCFNKILHLENMDLQEFPGSFAEYNRAMLETKIAMKEQASKDETEIEQVKKLVEKIRAAATYIDSPTKGKQLKARVSYLERLEARRAHNPFLEDFDYDFAFPPVEERKEDKPVISVKDYSLCYDAEILSNVSFEIFAGEKVAVVGANGTGKSSLLRDIYQMLQNRPDVSECVGYFTQIYEEDGEKLSGGERNIKQIREIATKSASILLLDEPTSHLDTYAQIALERAITEYKGTVLMVSHDFYTVMNCADRILILEDGTLREMSGRSYRKSIYKKYFDSDIFEQERIRRETEIRVNSLLKAGRTAEARNALDKII